MKVSIIGAGNVGATAAMKIASENFVDELVLLDIKEGVAEGKAIVKIENAPTIDEVILIKKRQEWAAHSPLN